MQIQVLASGSKGNCTLIMSENTNILIDVGILYTQIFNKLEQININLLKDIDGILLTHTHTDHIKGLEVLVKRTNCKVYVPKGMEEQIKDLVNFENIVIIDEKFTIGNLSIELIYTSHDVSPSVGFIIESANKNLVYVTDTGYLNQKYLNKLHNKTIYIIESNHDEKMLMDGPYPYYLKQRVVGDKGHLSNATTARYLEEIIGEDTKYIILAHLSENNNTEEIALKTLQERLSEDVLSNKKIILARQNESTELIEV